MKFKKNISLKPYNTFGIDANAENFISADSLNQLINIVTTQKNIFILSGGSNILLTKNITKPVIHINLKGIEILNKKIDSNSVLVKAQAGENWHEFVLWCIENNFGGLENLSLIPGNVGTSPMQNIGAYGTEIKDYFYELEALEIATGKIETFNNKACNFGYRESVFKNIYKGKYIIVSVTFQLTKEKHKLNTSYGAIQTELKNNNITNPTIKDVSNAVIAIRQSKLPDPKEIGNSGSFFKNPVITEEQFQTFQKKYPNAPFYKVTNKKFQIKNSKFQSQDFDTNSKPQTSNLKPQTYYKVPAGWLVEQCGFKGKRFGDAGVHKNQALVLVNYGTATGQEIFDLAQKILQTVYHQFNIDLEIEVNIV